MNLNTILLLLTLFWILIGVGPCSDVISNQEKIIDKLELIEQQITTKEAKHEH